MSCLEEFGQKYFSRPKHNWSQEELGEAYQVYNIVNSTNKTDSGCNSCRREVIQDLKSKWEVLQKTKNNK